MMPISKYVDADEVNSPTINGLYLHSRMFSEGSNVPKNVTVTIEWDVVPEPDRPDLR